ncbi:SRPBCC family protein [Nitrosospira sp. NpAV]|uniref:SRPBCC family protein n=1 Tax=Nitrosospira sp. NpAV TaxID=58133 RepID=UPI000A063A73|nr:SRPBCC family protein [Nitrosospira sp. NpAV]
MKINAISVALLPLLFLGEPVLAEGEKQAEKLNASSGVNPVPQIAQRHDTDIRVKVENDGEQIIINATFTVPVEPQLAWAVLTDFDNIPNFISSVQSSKVVGRSGNDVHVAQYAVEKYAFLTISLESVRKINLTPFRKIHERMISGSMRKMEETTQLLPEGNHTRIVYRAEIIPDVWILRFIGPHFIENEAQKQFQEISNEIMRRKRVLASG